MNDRQGLLLRVGIDQTCGKYNAPINPSTHDYMYLPIPQQRDRFISGMVTTYDTALPYFESWCQKNDTKIQFNPEGDGGCHLDPDFDYSTYGDQATGRGLQVAKLKKGDFIVFFASFKPITPSEHNLIYALYGMMVVDEVLNVAGISENEFYKNAHTRITNKDSDDLVVFADPSLSGRFNRAIPIGEFRNGSYRVKQEILEEWGDIDVKDGFIQRSVRPPWFKKPEQFLKWLDNYQVKLINSNWE
jgi:hypothetical protein